MPPAPNAWKSYSFMFWPSTVHRTVGGRARAPAPAAWIWGLLAPGRSAAAGDVEGALQHLVDEPVLPGLLRGEPAVPVGVLLDLLHALPGVEGDPLLEHLLHVQQVVGEDPDVGGGSADAAAGLVHHHPGVRQREALARRAGAEQELPHGRGHAHAHGADVVRDVLHDVV